MTTKRAPIDSFGRYGASVNVYAMTLDGEEVARVEWREKTGAGPVKRKTETFRGAKRDREARAKTFAKAKSEYLVGNPDSPKERYTVKGLWDAYYTANVADWRPKTRNLNLSRWKVFCGPAALDPYTFADLVTPEHLDAFRVRLLSVNRAKTGLPMARNQVAHHIQLVKAVWKHARERRLIAENVLADYAVRKGRDYGALAVPEYTPQEFAKIMAQLSYRTAVTWRAWAAIALDALLAPRSNALLQLQWTDVDPVKRRVTWRRGTDKVGKERIQPLPRDAVFVLRVAKVWARREGYAGPYVFYSPQQRTAGKAWTYSALNAALHGAADRAGVAYIPYRAMHSLRRMAGKSILELTGDITKVGAWLGDSDVRVLTRSYLRDRPEDLKAVVAGTSLPVAAAAVATPLTERATSKTSRQQDRCKRGHLYTPRWTRERKSPDGTIWRECLRCEMDRKAGTLQTTETP